MNVSSSSNVDIAFLLQADGTSRVKREAVEGFGPDEAHPVAPHVVYEMDFGPANGTTGQCRDGWVTSQCTVHVSANRGRIPYLVLYVRSVC